MARKQSWCYRGIWREFQHKSTEISFDIKAKLGLDKTLGTHRRCCFVQLEPVVLVGFIFLILRLSFLLEDSEFMFHVFDSMYILRVLNQNLSYQKENEIHLQ